MLKSLVLISTLVFAGQAYSDSWVSIEYGSTGLSHKSSSTVQNKTAVAADGIQRLDTVPFMKVKWLDENRVVLKEKNMTDPRAFWAPIGEHGSHEAIFIRAEGVFMLKKPHNAHSVEIELLNPVSAGRSIEKLAFN